MVGGVQTLQQRAAAPIVSREGEASHKSLILEICVISRAEMFQTNVNKEIIYNILTA